MQLAHFLDADLEPWAAALAGALFPRAAKLSDQVEASRPQAAVASASSDLTPWEDAWRRVEALSPPAEVISAAARASRMTLHEQLPLTPAAWRAAVLGNHAVNGALRLDFPAAAAYRGAMQAVHDVQGMDSLFVGTRVPAGSGLSQRHGLRSTSFAATTNAAAVTALADACEALPALTEVHFVKH